MSLVVKKVSYGIALRFPALGVDVSKELTESELWQFSVELKRFESAVECGEAVFNEVKY